MEIGNNTWSYNQLATSMDGEMSCRWYGFKLFVHMNTAKTKRWGWRSRLIESHNQWIEV